MLFIQATAFCQRTPKFAAAVVSAGLTFVGPKADAIARFGDKGAARALAEAAGVPIAPGLPAPVTEADALAFLKEMGPGGAVMLKGGSRRRRAWDAPSQQCRRPARCFRPGAGGSGSRIRRWPPLCREILPNCAPHRSAGGRRQCRERRPYLGARVQSATPAPKDR